MHDFETPMGQPTDWKKIDDKPEWCKYHGGGKHSIDGCMTAKDDIIVSQGLPSPSVRLVTRESRPAELRKKHRNLQVTRL
jgi:hypothetical protein